MRPQRARIYYLDSMTNRARRVSVLAIMYEWAKRLAPDIQWRKTALRVPQQDDTDNCGVFTCMFADCVFSGIDISFTRDDMNLFRKRITCALMRDMIPAVCTSNTLAASRNNRDYLSEDWTDQGDEEASLMGQERACSTFSSRQHD